MQPAGGQCGGAAVHGNPDLFSHGVPGEEKLHPQVRMAPSAPESDLNRNLHLLMYFKVVTAFPSAASRVLYLTPCLLYSDAVC